MALPPVAGALAASFSVAALSNLVNNLPSGLMAGAALQGMQVPLHLRNAVLIGVDLGPNLSVTGSLATLLWLMALRRERGGDYSRSVSESRAGGDAACAAFSDCRGGSAFLERQDLFANRVEIDSAAFHIGDVS